MILRAVSAPHNVRRFAADRAGCHISVMSDIAVFDRRAVRRHRDRAAPGFAGHDFLVAEVADRLIERLGGFNRRFARVLDLGCHTGGVARRLAAELAPDLVVAGDLSVEMARRAPSPALALALDEEALPFGPASFDLVVSALSLHWVNDLPGALVQIRAALAPDGLFLAALLGGDTLRELRLALLEAESAVEGGASPRVSPFADLRDAAGLLQRAGFALPVADNDTLTVTWTDPLALMRELRGMGETNAVAARRKEVARRETLFAAAARYQAQFGTTDGRVPASFQVIYLAGWAPDASQQQPLRPGSAATRLAEALGTREVSTGVKADPGRTG
jgi:SAM-dependent methyltransferase